MVAVNQRVFPTEKISEDRKGTGNAAKINWTRQTVRIFGLGCEDNIVVILSRVIKNILVDWRNYC